jgi:hypothetical protein
MDDSPPRKDTLAAAAPKQAVGDYVAFPGQDDATLGQTAKCTHAKPSRGEW